jgi:hypothetical protein
MAKDKIEIEVLAKGVSKVQKDIDKLKKAIKKTGPTTQKTGESMVGTFTAIAAGAFAAFQTIKKGLDLSKEFLQFQQGAQAMERQFGVSADEVIKRLKDVSKGTIANADIVTSANRAMALNVTSDLDEMAQLLEIARERGKALGVDTTQAFNDLVTGIGRGSPLILDNLGIITKGWDKEAKAVGKSMDAQFILNKVLKDGAELLKNTGDAALTGAEKFEKMAADAKDLRLVVGQVLSKEFLKIFDSFNKLGDSTDKVEKLVRVVRTLVALVRFLAVQFTFLGRIFIALISPIVEFVKIAVKGFEDIKTAFKSFLEPFKEFDGTIAGAKRAWNAFKDAGKNTFDVLKGLGGEYANNVKKTLTSQFDSAKGELGQLKDSFFNIFADIDEVVESSGKRQIESRRENIVELLQIDKDLMEARAQIKQAEENRLKGIRKKALADGYISEKQFTDLTLKEIDKRVTAERAAAKTKINLFNAASEAIIDNASDINMSAKEKLKEILRATVKAIATEIRARATAQTALAFIPPFNPRRLAAAGGLFAAAGTIQALGNAAIASFAGGGISSGGPAVVGERGPELVDLPSGSRVIPNHNIDNSSTTSFAGANITVVSNDPDDMLEKLEDKVNSMGSSIF